MSRSYRFVGRILTAGVLMVWAGLVAAQQAYPAKPIRFILPYAPGGSTTIVGHLVGQKLTESWGQQVLVDNRPGGNTIIGTEALVKAAPDGYTILMVSNALVINPHLMATSYDAFKDFAPVATLTSTEQMLLVHPSVAANNLREFIALAKSKPGGLNFASAGAGSPTHLAAALLDLLAGIDMQHVPYKGGGPALTALVAGEVQLYFSPPLPAMSYVKTGRLKAIAVSGEARVSAFPEVPTFTEAGVQGIDVRTWFGVLARAGTPNAIIEKQAAEIARILALPDVKAKLSSQGTEPFIRTPEQFATFMKAESVKFAKVIKTANIKIEQ